MSQPDGLRVYQCRWSRYNRKRVATSQGIVVSSSRRRERGDTLTPSEAIERAIEAAAKAGDMPPGAVVHVFLSIAARKMVKFR